MKDSYTTRPTRVRIFVEEWSEGRRFSIDGADNEGRYTVNVWSGYTDLETAFSDVPEFIEVMKAGGVVWEWDTDRPKRARLVTPTRGV